MQLAVSLTSGLKWGTHPAGPEAWVQGTMGLLAVTLPLLEGSSVHLYGLESEEQKARSGSPMPGRG